jgi:GxxExxY protein
MLRIKDVFAVKMSLLFTCERKFCLNSVMVKDPLTYKIIGCAMKVHNTLGPGFQEVIYQRCLVIEFRREGLAFLREHEQDIFYNGINVGTRRADFIVETNVMVEIKAVVNLEDVHLAQAKNYVVAYDLRTGLLLNFGARSLQYKLLFNQKYESEFSKFKN